MEESGMISTQRNLKSTGRRVLHWYRRKQSGPTIIYTFSLSVPNDLSFAWAKSIQVLSTETIPPLFTTIIIIALICKTHFIPKGLKDFYCRENISFNTKILSGLVWRNQLIQKRELKRQPDTFSFGKDIQADTSKYCNKPYMNNLRKMASEGIHKKSDTTMAGALEIRKIELKSLGRKKVITATVCRKKLML